MLLISRGPRASFLAPTLDSIYKTRSKDTRYNLNFRFRKRKDIALAVSLNLTDDHRPLTTRSSRLERHKAARLRVPNHIQQGKHT